MKKKNLNKTIPDHSGIPASDSAFYNQDHQIRELISLINNPQCTLIFVFGMGGIGKTALVSQALRQAELQAQTLWCNLTDGTDFQQNLEFIQEQWELNDHPSGVSASLCQYLEEQPKILVFDHWELLFADDNFSGSYQPQHEVYREALTELAKKSLVGTVVIISREVAPSMESLGKQSPLIETLTVSPLPPENAQQILQEYELADQPLWLEFVQTYRSNPLSIRLICTVIQEWFGGSISKFQQQNTIIGGDTLGEILGELIHRISPCEQEILYCLMLWGQPTTVTQLQENHQNNVLFPTEILNAVRSLTQRFLIEKMAQKNASILILQPSIQRYLVKEFTQVCCQEIMQAIATAYDLSCCKLLKKYKLSLPHYEDELILSPVIQPIIKGLQTHLRSKEQVKIQLEQLQQAAIALPSDSYNYIQVNLDTLVKYL